MAVPNEPELTFSHIHTESKLTCEEISHKEELRAYTNSFITRARDHIKKMARKRDSKGSKSLP